MHLRSIFASACLLGTAAHLTTSPAFAGLLITEAMSSGSINDWVELTNTGPGTLTISGFKLDDNSFAFGTSVNLLGVTTLGPNESAVFIESTSPGTEIPAFRSFWGGPALTIQVGSYTGSGVGLASGGDGVIIFDSAGVEQTRVSFGAATTNTSFGYNSFLYPSQTGFGGLSSAGSHGAYVSQNAAANVGSPGAIPEPGSVLLLALGSGVVLQRRWRAAARLAQA